MTNPQPQPPAGLVSRIAKALNPHRAVALLEAAAHDFVFEPDHKGRAAALRAGIEAQTVKGNPMRPRPQGQVPEGFTVSAPTPAPEERQERAQAVAYLANLSAKTILVARDEVANLAAELEGFGRWDFITQTPAGQKLLRTGPELVASIDRVSEAIAVFGGEALDRFATAPPGQAQVYRQELDKVTGFVLQIERLLQTAINDLQELVQGEAWKAVATEEHSGKATAIRLLIKGVAAVFNIGIMVGGAAASTAPGMNAAAGAVKTGVSIGRRRLERVVRDEDIKRLRAERAADPGFLYRKLDADASLMATRVAQKQKENLEVVMDLIGIPGSELPGWTLIRTAVESFLGAYYDAKVGKLKIHLRQVETAEEAFTEFVKSEGPPALLEAATESVAEAFKKGLESASEKAKEEALERVGKAVGESAEGGGHGGRAAEGAGEAGAEGGAEAVKTAGDIAGEMIKEFAVGAVESIAIRFAGLLLSKLLARAGFMPMAQAFTGGELRRMEATLADFNNAISVGVLEVLDEDGFDEMTGDTDDA